MDAQKVKEAEEQYLDDEISEEEFEERLDDALFMAEGDEDILTSEEGKRFGTHSITLTRVLSLVLIAIVSLLFVISDGVLVLALGGIVGFILMFYVAIRNY